MATKPQNPALPDQPPQPRKRIPTNQALAASASWLPAPYDLADATAVQALQRGTADAEQQRRALDWIIRQACATYDFPYRPGPDDRDTNIALGRMWAGQQIVKLCNADIGKMRRDSPT